MASCNDCTVRQELKKARDFIASVCDNTLYSKHDHADYDLLEEVEQAIQMSE